MIPLSTSVLAGALAEVAAAATISTGLTGIIGNRADAVFMRSFRAISAGFRHLSGLNNTPAPSEIITSVGAAFRRSFLYYIDTISTQSTSYSDRIAVEDIRSAFKQYSVNDFVKDTPLLADAVRPLLASLSSKNINSQFSVLEDSVIAVGIWCEQNCISFPDRFRCLLTEAAPNARRSWLHVFRDELATEILKNEAYASLLVSSNLCNIGEISNTIKSVVEFISSDIVCIKDYISSANQGILRIERFQEEQLTYLRQLAAFLPPVGSTSGHDTCLRVLGSCMFDSNGQPTPAGLILLSAFAGYYDIQNIDRGARLNLIRDVHVRLLENLGPNAYINRFDAGEFDIIVRDVASQGQLQLVCEGISRDFLRPFEVDGNVVFLTPKLGAAIAPNHGFSPESLQANADLALRDALSYGSSDIVIYRQGLRSDAAARRSLEHDIRIALEASQFHLVYQPIMRLGGNLVSGFEALVRWSHPVRGDIRPADFIPVAEEMGLIPQLGEWIMQTACIHAAQWPEDIRVSVNVSPIQFKSKHFVKFISDALSSSGLTPHRLEIEVTEGIFLEESNSYVSKLENFRDMNVRVSLDDFGTGYSSLGYIRNASLNTIKIDQSFVRGVAHGQANRSIVTAIIALCRSMNLDVIAEGVENEEDLVALQELGCNYGQGYLFGRPLAPIDALRAAQRGTVQ